MTEEYVTDKKDVTRKDGQVYDTIPNYMWTNYVGGVLDGEEIIGRDMEKKVIKHGEEEGCIYSRRVYTYGPFRLIAYVSVHHPRSHFWPNEVMREMAKTHHHLMKTDYNATRGLKRDE